MADPLDLDVKALGKTLRRQASGFRHLADETLGDCRTNLLALATDYDHQASRLEHGDADSEAPAGTTGEAQGSIDRRVGTRGDSRRRPGCLHVLVVEDEPLVREVLHETLQAEYDVSCAATVGQACDALDKSHIDLVLVDSILPDGHGDDVAIVADTLGVPIVAMSGYPPETNQFDRPHLVKPFKANLLFSTIEATLRLRGRNSKADTAC
jgi:CheY-like chemotaxis protein